MLDQENLENDLLSGRAWCRLSIDRKRNPKGKENIMNDMTNGLLFILCTALGYGLLILLCLL